MHEYAVTKSMVDMVLAEAEKANATKVTEIRIAIGDLSTVVDESVMMYFELMRAGTIAEEAKLTFRRIPAEFFCASCNKNYVKPPRGGGLECPECGGRGMPTEVGREFFIESIDID